MVSQGLVRSGVEYIQDPTIFMGSLLVLDYLHCKNLPAHNPPPLIWLSAKCYCRGGNS